MTEHASIPHTGLSFDVLIIVTAVDSPGNDVTHQLLHGLLSRIDHLEFNVMQTQRSDVERARGEVDSVEATVSRTVGGRQLEAQDIAIADAWARAPRHVPSGGHRGPGAAPAPEARPSCTCIPR